MANNDYINLDSLEGNKMENPPILAEFFTTLALLSFAGLAAALVAYGLGYSAQLSILIGALIPAGFIAGYFCVVISFILFAFLAVFVLMSVASYSLFKKK